MQRKILAFLSGLVLTTSLLVPGQAFAADPETGGSVGQNSVEFTTQANTNTRDGGGDIISSGGNYVPVPGCYYAGSHTWGNPRGSDPHGTPKTSNSVNSESAYYNGASSFWVEGWERRLAQAANTFNTQINTRSIFWRNNYPHLLAAALQISKTDTGAWRLDFEPPAERGFKFSILDLALWVQPPTTPAFFQGGNLGGGMASGGVHNITLTNWNANNAWVWSWGATPTIRRDNGVFDTQGEVWYNVKARLGYYAGLGRPLTDTEMAFLLYKDSRGFSIDTSSATMLIKLGTSYIRNWSTDIAIWRPGETYYTIYDGWTVQQMSLRGEFPAGTKYNVLIHFANLPPQYTAAEVRAGFKAVVEQQLNTQWNQSPLFADGFNRSMPKGSYYFPVMAGPANGGHCTGDSLSFFGLNLRRTTGGCPAINIRSDADVRRVIARPDACYLYWQYRRQEPPKLTADQFRQVASQDFDVVTFDGTAGAAVVNQPISFTADSDSMRRRGFHFDLPIPGFSQRYRVNLTQVGLTVRVGTEVLLELPRTSRASDYNFSLTFDQTPAAKMQETECARLRTAADLERICGITFQRNAEGDMEPVYVVTIDTWWDSIYQVPGTGIVNPYRGTFSTAHATIPSEYRNRISNLDHPLLGDDPSDRWIASWGFPYRPYNGNSPEPWTYTNGSAVRFGDINPDEYGAPMYSAICGTDDVPPGARNERCRNGDYQILIPVIQIQPTGG